MVYTLNNLHLFQLCQFTCLRFLTAREKRVPQCHPAATLWTTSRRKSQIRKPPRNALPQPDLFCVHATVNGACGYARRSACLARTRISDSAPSGQPECYLFAGCGAPEELATFGSAISIAITSWGRTGNRVTFTPYPDNASTIALTTAGRAPITPPSPTPLNPPSVSGDLLSS
jgi:hypothetical protein